MKCFLHKRIRIGSVMILNLSLTGRECLGPKQALLITMHSFTLPDRSYNQRVGCLLDVTEPNTLVFRQNIVFYFSIRGKLSMIRCDI